MVNPTNKEAKECPVSLLKKCSIVRESCAGLAATFTNETDPRYELRAALGEAAGYLVVLEAERGQMSRIIDDLEKRK